MRKKFRSKSDSKIRLSGPRDERLLIYLWKWKLSTTQALSEKFFPAVAPATAYRRLWTLSKGEFIQCRSDRSGRKFMWELGKRGYEAIRGHLPESLEEEGFKSEHPGHDLLASAFHMGDYAHSVPENVRMFSEQQLRRLKKSDYPSYICPFGFHVPDGYTLVKREDGKDVTIAFEAEINPKGLKEYSRLYSASDEYIISYVFWLVSKFTHGKRIYRHFTGYDSSPGDPKHVFITYPQFLKLGWGAPIVCGSHEGKSIRWIMEQLTQNHLKSKSKLVEAQSLLNLSKAPFKSKGYKFYEIGDFAR